MADRYWVGGAGTWSTSSTTHWSTTSGGTGGASVPTSSDSVFFDQLGTYTVTMSGAVTCLDITVSVGTVTFSSSGSITVSGSMSLIAGTVWSASGGVAFNSTTTGKTITTNGTSIGSTITFNGIGGGWTLGSSLTLTSVTLSYITIAAGTFDSASYSISANSLRASGSSVKVINLNASTVTLTNTNVSASSISFSGATNLTFNAGTSTINFTGYLNPGLNLTFYNVNITGYNGSPGSIQITNSHVFNNLLIAAPSSVSRLPIYLYADQTINGTFSNGSTSVVKRLHIQSDTIGTTRTLTVGTLSVPNSDFSDINIAGSAYNTLVLGGGNCSRNQGIQFPSSKTVYWNLAGSQNYSATAWCTSTDGGTTFSTPDINNFPLAQDTAIFNNNSLGTAITMTGWNLGNIDASSRTNALTFVAGFNIYGDFKLGNGITISYTSLYYLLFYTEGTSTVLINGKTTGQNAYVRFECPGGTVNFTDAFATNQGVWLTAGTLNLNGYTLTCSSFQDYTYSGSVSNYTRSLNFGSSGTMILNTSTGLISWRTSNGASQALSVYGTGTVTLTGTGGSRQFSCVGTANLSGITLNNASTGTYQISFGANANVTLNSITNSVTPADFTFNAAGMTINVSDFNVSGSVGNLVTIRGNSTFLSKSSGVVSADYLSLTNSKATGGASWYAGSHSINNSGNTGWIFADVPVSVPNFFYTFLLNHPL